MTNSFIMTVILGVISSYINPSYAEPLKNTNQRTLQVGLVSPPSSLNMLNSDLEVSVNTHQQLFLSLLDPDGTPEWRLIKHWNVSDDGLIYTIHLREDIFWSDGSLLKAQDWIAAINYQIDGYSTMGQQIYGAVKRDINNKAAVKAIDDSTVRVTLMRPDPLFIDRLIISNASVLKQSQWAKLGENWFSANNILTISPFKITHMNLPSSMTLEKIPNFPHADSLYWKKVHIRFIDKLEDRIKKLQTGELDVIKIDELNTAIGEADNLPGKLLLSKWPNSRFIIINPSKKKTILSNKLRKAIALLADPYTLNHLFSKLEKPMYNIIPPDIDAEYQANKQPVMSREERFSQAKKILESLNINPSQPIHLLFRVLDQRSNTMPAQRLYEIAKSYGIILNIVKSNSKEHYHAIFNGQYDIATLEWFFSVPSAEQQLIPFGLDSAFFKLGYNNSDYIAELKKVKQATTKKAMYKALRKAETILLNDHYVLPLSRFFYAYMIGPKLAKNQELTHRLWRFKPAKP